LYSKSRHPRHPPKSLENQVLGAILPSVICQWHFAKSGWPPCPGWPGIIIKETPLIPFIILGGHPGQGGHPILEKLGGQGHIVKCIWRGGLGMPFAIGMQPDAQMCLKHAKPRALQRGGVSPP